MNIDFNDVDISFEDELSPQNEPLSAVTEEVSEFGPSIPVGDGGYRKERLVTVNNQDIKFEYDVPVIPTMEHELSMWNKINIFEQGSWDPTNTGLDTGWESINKAFDGGLKAGFIIVAGDSNLG